MRRRLLALSVFVAGAVVVIGQQPPVPTPPRQKQRIHEVPTPGILGRLRTEASPRPSIDATGIEQTGPDVWDVDPATGAQYRRGEVLVRFRRGVSSSLQLRALATGGGDRVSRALPGNWNVVELRDQVSPVESVRALRRRLEVQDATLHYRVETQQVRPNDEFHHLQWNFELINMSSAWGINPGATNDVIVSVIDTGLNFLSDTIVFDTPLGQIPIRFGAVPDLVTDERVVAPYDFVYDDELPVDLGGHGTHVAGTIAQQTNNSIGLAGVAYNVRIMPLKVISGGPFISWDDVFAPGNRSGSAALIAEAVRYAADNGAKVINLSLGGRGPLPVVRDAISYAVSRGAFVAISAGNDALDGNPLLYPAAYASQINGAMAVGAVNRGVRRATYSSFHPYVEVCAPGGEMRTGFDFERGVTQIGYEDDSTLTFLTGSQKIAALLLGFRPRFDRFEPRPLDGTSMASPHIAGVAALLYSQGIRSPGAIEEAIKRFARPIDATAEECGAGLVDARRVLRGLGLAR